MLAAAQGATQTGLVSIPNHVTTNAPRQTITNGSPLEDGPRTADAAGDGDGTPGNPNAANHAAIECAQNAGTLKGDVRSKGPVEFVATGLRLTNPEAIAGVSTQLKSCISDVKPSQTA